MHVPALPSVPESHALSVDSVDRNTANSIDDVSSHDAEWERIAVKIDSGAIDTVMPPSIAKQCPIMETQMSQNGPGFRAANGTQIQHYGERSLNGLGDMFQPISIKAQVADVRSTLGSVNQMLKAGNVVHFESGNCYIRNASTGRTTPKAEHDGTFEVGIWAPRKTSSKTIL